MGAAREAAQREKHQWISGELWVGLVHTGEWEEANRECSRREISTFRMERLSLLSHNLPLKKAYMEATALRECRYLKECA